MAEKTKVQTPPYISWKTVGTYIQSLQKALPARIDTSGMIRLAGGMRGPMLNALKFLKLIGDDGTPEPALRELVDTSAPEKKDAFAKVLAKVLESAYPSLFETGADLPNMTPKQFGDKFEKLGVSGDTVRKSQSFFLDAARDAGVKVSPLVLDARKKGPKSPRLGASIRGKKGRSESADSAQARHYTSVPESVVSQWYATFKPAFDKLPDPDEPHWTRADREAWVSAIEALLDLYVRVDE